MPGSTPLYVWIAFHLLLVALLAVDAGVTRTRPATTGGNRKATWMPGVWILSALLFAVWIAHALRPHLAAEYLAGYGVEESLSIDNMFVFLLIFRSFGFTLHQQRRVLFWGVLGAIAMRACMIAAGLTLVRLFDYANVLFGVILLFAALRLLRKQPDKEKEQPKWIALVARFLPLSARANTDRFFVREEGRLRCTHLLLALLVIEVTDLFFAVDSIPAVLAVSHHPFIVYSSNIFAVLGLRSLYFVVAAMLERVHQLHYGLAAMLVFMGAKLLLGHVVDISIGVTLGVMGAVLALTVVLSLVTKPAATE